MKKTINDYGGAYEVTDDGQVYSCSRLQAGKYPGFFSRRMGRKLKPQLTKGYLTVALCKDGKTKRVSIHRLVWKAFFGEIPCGMQINHKDGNKINNNLRNLELLSPLENTRHAWRTGLVKKRYGEHTSIAKLCPAKVREIRMFAKQGWAQNKIAKHFGIHQTNVHYILIGKTWGHVSI